MSLYCADCVSDLVVLDLESFFKIRVKVYKDKVRSRSKDTRINLKYL